MGLEAELGACPVLGRWQPELSLQRWRWEQALSRGAAGPGDLWERGVGAEQARGCVRSPGACLCQ